MSFEACQRKDLAILFFISAKAAALSINARLGGGVSQVQGKGFSTLQKNLVRLSFVLHPSRGSLFVAVFEEFLSGSRNLEEKKKSSRKRGIPPFFKGIVPAKFPATAKSSLCCRSADSNL